MNFRAFQRLYEHAAFDEIKVIGKDIVKEGHPGHIIGMTRKDKQVRLYILELCESLDQEELCQVPHMERTRREQMKHSMESGRNRGFFLHIRSFQCGDRVLETAGANSGNMQNGDYSEAYLLFMKFLEAGWRVEEGSPFYTTGWKNLAITNIELREEMEQLPEWSRDVWITYDIMPKEGAVELPVTLEVGKTEEISFVLQDGRDATCYINRVHLMDVWAEEEKKFADPAYRERMLQHVSEEQLEQMKEQFFKALLEICPKGMCFPVIEYECTEQAGLRFLDREYLDTAQKPSKGSATSVLMMMKPDVETGSHGLKLRACVIQTPMEATTERIEAELFSYTEMIQKRTEKLSL